ncbi:MAG: hypothetical protein QXH95_03365 [Thermoplasmata archaeon]
MFLKNNLLIKPDEYYDWDDDDLGLGLTIKGFLQKVALPVAGAGAVIAGASILGPTAVSAIGTIGTALKGAITSEKTVETASEAMSAGMQMYALQKQAETLKTISAEDEDLPDVLKQKLTIKSEEKMGGIPSTYLYLGAGAIFLILLISLLKRR